MHWRTFFACIPCCRSTGPCTALSTVCGAVHFVRQVPSCPPGEWMGLPAWACLPPTSPCMGLPHDAACMHGCTCVTDVTICNSRYSVWLHGHVTVDTLCNNGYIAWYGGGWVAYQVLAMREDHTLLRTTGMLQHHTYHTTAITTYHTTTLLHYHTPVNRSEVPPYYANQIEVCQAHCGDTQGHAYTHLYHAPIYPY